jgi:hypothetical protein
MADDNQGQMSMQNWVDAAKNGAEMYGDSNDEMERLMEKFRSGLNQTALSMNSVLRDLGYTPNEDFIIMSDYWLDSRSSMLRGIVIPSFVKDNPYNATRMYPERVFDYKNAPNIDNSPSEHVPRLLFITQLLHQIGTENPYPTPQCDVTDTIDKMADHNIQSDVLIAKGIEVFLTECLISRAALASQLRSKCFDDSGVHITETFKFEDGTIKHTLDGHADEENPYVERWL